MRLNQYIAHSGLCSRREADAYIKDGKVTINDKPIESIAVMVEMDDIVKIEGKVIYLERKVYILLNKPKDYITTTDDELDRKTVLDLVKPQMRNPELKNIRFYPVGRLDRNTSGLLLLTNDGELTQELTHPKYNIEKIYIVNLDKKLTQDDADKIIAGLELEDGIMTVDELAYPDPDDKTKIGISIHSGKNRIVRRIFEHLGYEVKQLDRIVYAGLTKKDLPRGKWRFLEVHEIGMLKNRGKKTPQQSIQEKESKRKKNSLYDSGLKKREFKPKDKEVKVPTKEVSTFKEFRANKDKTSNSNFKPREEKVKSTEKSFFKEKSEFKDKSSFKPRFKTEFKPKFKDKSTDEKNDNFDKDKTQFKPRFKSNFKENKREESIEPISGKRVNKTRIKELKPKTERYKSKDAGKSNEYKPKKKESDFDLIDMPKIKPNRNAKQKLTNYSIPKTKNFSKKK